MALHPERSGIANGGEIIGLGSFMIVFVAIIFMGISTIHAVAGKNDHNFYWWLNLAIIIPLVFIFNI